MASKANPVSLQAWRAANVLFPADYFEKGFQTGQCVPNTSPPALRNDLT